MAKAVKKRKTIKQSMGQFRTRKPRQARLPGVEDPEIEGLHALAEQHAEKRDHRQAILKEEVELKNALLELMHKHDRTHYLHDGIEITVVPEKERVKVKVKGKESDGEEPEEGEE
jgi:hypothetical protein